MKSLDQILSLVAAGAADADLVSTLAAHLARLDRQLLPAQKTAIKKVANGQDLTALCEKLLNSINPAIIVEAASRRFYPTYLQAAFTAGFFRSC